MNKLFRKCMSWLLVLCMVLTLLPVTAFATGDDLLIIDDSGDVGCVCESLCSEDDVNTDCPVCGEEGFAACMYINVDVPEYDPEDPPVAAPMAAPAANTMWLFDGSTTSESNVALGGGTYSWDLSNLTLTLNNVTWSTSNAEALRVPSGTTIVLNGTNTITSTYASTSNSYGIRSTGSLTINGGGTLNATAGTSGSGNSIGIRADAASLSIDGSTISATGGSGAHSYGIYSAGSLSVNNSTINAASNNSSASMSGSSNGIYATSGLTFSGSTINATGGTVTNGTSAGVRLGGDFTMTGGEITAKGNTYAMGVSGTVPTSGITIKGNSAGGTDVTTGLTGMFDSSSPKKLVDAAATDNTLKYAEITMAGGSGGGTADFTLNFKQVSGTWGLYQGYTGTTPYTGNDGNWSVSDNTLTLTDFEFTTIADTALYVSADTTIVIEGENKLESTYNGAQPAATYGIKAALNLTINGGGTLEATGGNTSGANSYGVYVATLTMNGGTLYATANSGSYSCGVCSGDFVMTGGTIYAKGNDYAAELYGNISDGVVIKGKNANDDNYEVNVELDDDDGYTVQNEDGSTPVTDAKITVAGPTRTKMLNLQVAEVEKQVDTTKYPTNATIDALAAEGWAWYPNNATEEQTGMTGGVTGKVLVLDGLKLETADTASVSNGTRAAAIAVPANTTIVIKGDSSAVSTYAEGTYTSCGITSYSTVAGANLTITGDDSKTLTVAAGGTGTSYGIYITNFTNSNGLIMNGGTLKTSGAATSNSQGIYIYDGNFVMNGGTIEATGNGSFTSYGISVNNSTAAGRGNFTMSGGTIYAKYTGNPSIKAAVLVGGTTSGGLVITKKNGENYDQDGALTDSDIKIVSGLTVTYDANTDDPNLTGDVPTAGGGLANDTVTVAGNTGKLACPGYIFDGWYKEAACTTPAGASVTIGTENITLYAKWTAINFTLYYNNSDSTMRQNTSGGTVVTTDQLPHWSGSSATLTLADGFNFTTSADTALVVPASTIIATSGTSTIASTAASGTTAGITCAGSLTFQGSGTLNAIGGDGGNSYGIHVTGNSTLTVTAGTVNATGGTASTSSRGVYIQYDNNGTGGIAVVDGTLNATSGSGGAFNSRGINISNANSNGTGSISVTGTGSIFAKGNNNAAYVHGLTETPAGLVIFAADDAGGPYDIPAKIGSSGFIVKDSSGTEPKYAQIGKGVTVTYALGTGGGTAPDAVTVVSGGTVTLPGIGSMTAPTGNKYLKGWNDGTNNYDVGATSPAISANTTMTAQWADIDFTLYYKNDGELYIDAARTKKVTDVMALTGFSSEASGNTLVLNNFSFSTKADTALSMPGGTKIKVTGNSSSVTSTYSGSSNTYGIFGAGALAIEVADGKTLTAKSGTGTVLSQGIGVNGAFTMSGDGAIEAFAQGTGGSKIAMQVGSISSSGVVVKGYGTSAYDVAGQFKNDSFAYNTANAAGDAYLARAKIGRGFALTYDANGGTDTVTGDLPTAGGGFGGDNITVAGNTGKLVRPGYIFDGWNTAANGSGTDYAKDAAFNISADTTLYAKWTAIDFTLYYDHNGSKMKKNNSSGAEITTDQLPHWTGSGATLTLTEGFNFTTSAAGNAFTASSDTTTINVTGDAAVHSTNASAAAAGLYVDGALTIDVAANKTFTASVVDATSDTAERNGIKFVAALTKTGAGTLTATAANAQGNSRGIHGAVAGSSLTVTEGAVVAKGKAMGVDVHNVTVNGGSLTAAATGDMSYGMCVGTSLAVTGTGSITANGKMSAVYISGATATPNGLVILASSDEGVTYDTPAKIDASGFSVKENGYTAYYAQIGKGVTVTYALGTGASGTVPTAATVVSGGTVTLPGITDSANYFMTPPAGKYLKGWNDGSTTHAVGATYTVSDNKTLTAQWQNIDFTLYYNKADGKLYINSEYTTKAADVMSITTDFVNTADSNNTLVLSNFTFTTTGSPALVMPAGTKIKVTADSTVSSTNAGGGAVHGIKGEGALEIEVADSKTFTAVGNGSGNGIFATGNFTMSGNGAIVAHSNGSGAAVSVGGTVSDNIVVRGKSGENYTVAGKFSTGSPSITQNVQGAAISQAKLALGYTVTYDGNGATGGTAPADGTVYSINGSGTATVVGKGDLTKGGITFAGWNTQADGRGTDYAANATVTVSSNITLYAKWVIDFTLYYNSGDGKMYKTFTFPDTYSNEVTADAVGNWTGTSSGNNGSVNDILTLNESFSFITSAKTALVVPAGITINVTGNATLASTDTTTAIGGYGIEGYGDLAIKVASGKTLTVTTADTTAASSSRRGISTVGYFALNVSTLNAGTLNVTAGNAAQSSIALSVGGNFTMSSGKLNATGGAATISNGVYLYNDSMFNMFGGILTAKADMTNVTGRVGLSLFYSTTTYYHTGGTVYASGGFAGVYARDMASSGNITIRGNGTKDYTVPGKVSTSGASEGFVVSDPAGTYLTDVRITPKTRNTPLDFTTDGLSYKEFSDATKTADPTAVSILDSIEGWKWYLNATGSELDTNGATGNVLVLNGLDLEVDGDEFAIKVPDGTTIVVISDSSIEANNGDPIDAIYADGNLFIDTDQNVTLTVEAGDSTDEYTCGIFVKGNFTKKGKGTLSAQAGTPGDGFGSYGIAVEGNFTFTDGEIIAIADETADDYYAMYVVGTVPTSGITVKGYGSGSYSVTAGFVLNAGDPDDPDDNYYNIKSGDTVVSNAKITVPTGTVATPTFSPAAGTYSTTQSVTISTTTTGATIHYTTDGTTPTTSSSTYSSAISVSATTTIKAIAVKSGMTDSAVATASYTINTGGGGGGGSSSTPNPTPAPTPDVSVIVDGKPVDAGKVETKNDTTTVTVNQDVIQKQIETATNNVTIVVPAETGTAVAQLVVQNVDDMAAKEMTLTVQVGNVQYELPTTAIDTASVLAALGAANAADVPISISVTTDMNAASQTAANNAVVTSGGELVIPPIEFKITATYNGQTVEIDTFSQYVSRAVEVTAEQAGKITTAVVVEPDGTTRQVPTRVYQQGGKWYAEINSLTNSTYAVIYNEKTFTDAKGKWYEAAVNEMGSRMIISGIGGDLFAGERDITRAEFAAIIVRALGLPANGNGAVFSDVSRSAWYCGAVGTAYEYGLVSGIGNNKFAPDNQITRQEAMMMIYRAAKLASFDGSTGNLNAFTDAGTINSWALDAASWNVGSGLIVGSGGKIRGNDNITRAETATLVLKLLQMAGLVDVRDGGQSAQAAVGGTTAPAALPAKESDLLQLLSPDNDDSSDGSNETV